MTGNQSTGPRVIETPLGERREVEGRIARWLSGHFVKIFQVQQALLYKGLQLCKLIYRVRMVIAGWNFDTTLRPPQGVDFNFGGWGGGGGGAPTPKKLFFPIFIFLQRTIKKSRFGTPKFFGGRGPLPSGENSPLNFFSFRWIETRWINKSAKFGPARCNPWGATGPPKFANVWIFGQNILSPAVSLI